MAFLEALFQGFMEFILSLFLDPIEAKITKKTNKIPNKWLRRFIYFSLALIFIAVIFGLLSLTNFLTEGYWI